MIIIKKIPIAAPYFTKEESENISKVLSSGWVAQGPQVGEFENIVAKHEGIKFGIATTNCTTALHLALVSLGVGKGQDIILPSYTFIATANAITYTGAQPVFVDIDLDTFNIKIDSVVSTIENDYSWNEKEGQLTNKLTGNTLRGIIPVHLFGLCADIYKINEIAKKYNLLVLEDSACALGAKIKGIHQGNFGNPSCISFHPRKSITTGEGGMVLTSNKALADRLRMLRSHGASVSETDRHKNGGFLLPEFNELGFNYRMNDIQAGVGIAQMAKFDWILDEKRKKAKLYDELLSKLEWLIIPTEPEGYYHTYQSYVCMLREEYFGNSIEKMNDLRNELMQKLEEVGISTRQGTSAVHTLGYYKNKNAYKNESYINSYKADKLSIALPLYVQITEEDINYVVDNLNRIKNSIL